MAYVLALDQGTTSSRAILFDQEGRIVELGPTRVPPDLPRPGSVEHDPQEIWTSQIATAVEVLGSAELRPRDVAAVGITNQRETTVVWDRDTGQPLGNAIVWQDRRTAGFCDRLRAEGLEATDPRAHRARPRRLLLRHQGPLDPRQRSRGAGAGGGGKAGLRHRGHLARLPADRAARST